MPKQIKDFGKVLTGAKKHTYTSSVLQDTPKESDFKISDLFPALDVNKLQREGLSDTRICWLHKLRYSVPTRPRKRHLISRWEQTVLPIYSRFREVLDMPEEEVVSFCKEDLQVQLRLALGLDNLKMAIGVDFRTVLMHMMYFGRDEDGNHIKEEYDPPRHFTRVRGISLMRGDMVNRLAIDNTLGDEHVAQRIQEMAEAIIKLHTEKSEHDMEPTQRLRKYYGLYRDRDKRIYVGRKIRSTMHKVIVLETEDTKEAREIYAEDGFYEKCEAAWQKMKEPPVLRREENRPRTALDADRYADVTPEAFSKAFAFRGVQFGTYVEQGKRQLDLNQAYDALNDLARALGCETQDLSLHESLGLAFGARGHGGRNAAAAHYEPDTHVINLTKSSGAGSLAHEWFHALDYYASGSMRAPASEAEVTSSMYRGQETPKAIQTLRKALSAFGDAMALSPVCTRSKAEDSFRSKPYYSTKVEMTARAFEVWVIHRLSDLGIVNDYLANVTDDGVYLTPDELRGMTGVFDRVIDAFKAVLIACHSEGEEE